MRKFPRKRTILVLAIVIALAAVVSAVGVLATRSNSLLEIFQTHKGDADIVLVVNGEPVQRATIRQPTEFTLLYGHVAGPSFPVEQLSADEAKLVAVRAALRTTSAYTEAKHRGIEVSAEEAQRIADWQRSLIEKARADSRPSKASQETLKAFDALVKASGLSENEWWNQEVEKYRWATHVTKLRQQVLAQLPCGVTTEERIEYWEHFVDSLVANAKVEVQDKTLEPLVEKVLSEVKD